MSTTISTSPDYPTITLLMEEAAASQRRCSDMFPLVLVDETVAVGTTPERLETGMTIPRTIDDNNKEDYNTDDGNEKMVDSPDRVSPTCVITAWEDEDDTDLPKFQGAQQQQTQANEELLALREALEETQTRRARMQENLRQKRLRVQSLEKELAAATTEVAESRGTVKALETQQESLREGLLRLSVTRDTFKSRWKEQIQINKELHEQLAVEQARWRREEVRRAKEEQLLDLYRKLSKLTGYQQMGKEIRNLEAELAAWSTK
eukprot:scaffold2043_cov166-Amphora_coffeaeformis.AAC.3